MEGQELFGVELLLKSGQITVASRARRATGRRHGSGEERRQMTIAERGDDVP